VMNELLATVGSIYAAFGRGDIPAILDTLADDVSWEDWAQNEAQAVGVPWLLAKKGKSAVTGFFEVVGQMQIHDFKVLSMMVGDNQVAVEVQIDATSPSGGRYQDEELHLWSFNAAGKVRRLRHYVDTAKHIRAAGLLK
jgi:ketosteroid isomerase-like protein